jgi:hypothetical protein
MTDLERDPTTPEPEASELEGGGTGQNWGQGEGAHEPTIPDRPDQPDKPDKPDEEQQEREQVPPTYSGGTAADLDDPDLPLARDDEGMDR